MKIDLKGYTIQAQIYESINSIVYRGVDEQTQQPAILKMLKSDYPSSYALTRYRQEYKILKNLKIPGVIKVYDLKPYRNTLFLVLEDFGGTSLRNYLNPTLNQQQGFSIGEFLPIAIEIADTLGQIHVKNIIHKDINPANLVVHPETQQVKIIDFGIASVLTRENPILKSPDVLEGTLAYISPEQTGRMNRFLDYRSDFYSLGVTFYELLTGTLPFTSDDALELVHCHIAKIPEAIGMRQQARENGQEIPQVLGDIVMKLMAKTAEERYQSAWGLKADLERCWEQFQTRGTIINFPLATHDISTKLQIPQKLYGREREIKILLTAFERVTGKIEDSSASQNPKSELMLVAGYSGIGKSALVHELHKSVTRSRGYFISGKFDQFQRNIPYSALVRAFQGLIQQLLTESPDRLKQWQEKLQTSLGTNGKIIIDVIPEVEYIIGKQPPIAELAPTETQNRFHLVFTNFLQVFASWEHPLVIFLDDLQWADSATLKLIYLIMNDVDICNLLIIGAYRNNEVSATHPLMVMLDELEKDQAIVNEIELKPLDCETITYLLSDTLNTNLTTVRSFSELIFSKTKGNPFFTNEFIKTLYTEKQLNFDLTSRTWQWNIQAIKALNITDNVVELMIDKLYKLPDRTQTALYIAACLEAEFHLDTLSIICDRSAKEIFSDLQAALRSELIFPLSELDEELLIREYKFGHDRIQQAAYNLIKESEKKEIHLKIGRALLHKIESEKIRTKIFNVVDQFNLALDLIIDESERDRIAELNLIAAQKSQDSAAYEPALQYLQAGIQLLGDRPWLRQYNLMLSLSTKAVSAAYSFGDFVTMDRFAREVLENARSLLDRIKVEQLLLYSYLARQKFREAIEKGLEIVELLDPNLLLRLHSFDFNRDIKEIKEILGDRQASDLLKHSLLQEENKIVILEILSSLVVPTIIADPSLFIPIVLQMTLVSMRSGNAPESTYGYAWYGLILTSITGEIEAGYQFGQLALNLLNQLNVPELTAKVNIVVYFFIAHWRDSLNKSLKPLKTTYIQGIETGDIAHAGWAAYDYCNHLFWSGKELTAVAREMVNYNHAIRKIKQQAALSYLEIYQQTIENLSSSVEQPDLLAGKYYQEQEMLAFYQANGDRTGLSFLYVNKLVLGYLFGEYENALKFALHAATNIAAVPGIFVSAVLVFYDSLTRLALFDRIEARERDIFVQKVEENQAKLQIWATHAPMNFQHKYDLVVAEKVRVLSRDWQAAEVYDRAIRGARENGYYQEEALANELAAQFYRDRGIEKVSCAYLRDAYYGYTRWGAIAKVESLARQHPDFIQNLTKTISTTITQTRSLNVTNTSTSTGEILDLAAAIEASQAIGSEIVLDKLLQTLMTLILANAGATRGVLLLEQQGQLSIEAEGRVESPEIKVLQSLPLDDRLPVSLIHYVARTGETVVLHNAALEGNFSEDAYIQKQRSRSLLCFPLIERGSLVSIIFLENNLTSGAFSPDRLQLLQLLSGQAAISIVNSRLYHTLEEKVKQRTAQLAEANAEIRTLNQKLTTENLRLGAELDVAKQMQQMILPKAEELDRIKGLAIAGFMEPADEVGGDYYDVLQQDDIVTIAIGDVTGHGLESGILMVMVQTAVRTLHELQERDPKRFLNTLNRTIYNNVQRMNVDKNLTLVLLNYQEGRVSISGQHEEILAVRKDGEIHRIDTIDLGFPIGLEVEISEFVQSSDLELEIGDGLVLYTDGIIEAQNKNQEFYGIERLCDRTSQYWSRSVAEIQHAIIEDVKHHIGQEKMFDDLTLLIIKRQ
ncbi:AAA family ATPase [Spirulina sp. 06S082]|uniref:AAA family ATPase n=1 Tax=Spirulina sp. 06S082 TaxID=3110248 RepID=UPI002B1F1EAD|nr:AAA family ATPase [Spirulina sp. 06S082]MEA5470480.1 AAA family ATPase [Spirulina sp. 06S082]